MASRGHGGLLDAAAGAPVSKAGSVEIVGPPVEGLDEILTEDAIRFVTNLHRRFDDARLELLRSRADRQQRISSGELPDFLADTADIRSAEWSVASVPDELLDRRVEITGPTDRKTVINALNSGARVFMADFEDANTPTWSNLISGQRNLIEAIEGSIEFTSPEGKEYRLGDQLAVLFVRPRGWHLAERHMLVDGRPVSGSLFDVGLFLFHCARRLLDRGSGPYLYLPKLESHLEARLWNDVFCYAQDVLAIPRGTIKATVLVETILAAFEMDEILYELRDHSAGLNAGRWDYLFSIIKKFRQRPEFVLPDRVQVTMDVPFMKAYARLLVATCHRRGAHAMGGMAAFIPNRRDPQVNALALDKVREDKTRESGDGFDGTWVAHPDLVPVAKEPFDTVLAGKPNQLSNRPKVDAAAEDLLDVRVPDGSISEEGLRNDVGVGVRYIASWLRGAGAAAINDLMEDAATAEIARAQVWQWVHHGVTLSNGRTVTPELVRETLDRELELIRSAVGGVAYADGMFDEAGEVFEEVALAEPFVEFLTGPASQRID
jgi:malate synthase